MFSECLHHYESMTKLCFYKGGHANKEVYIINQNKKELISRIKRHTIISETNFGSPKFLKTKWEIWVVVKIATICVWSSGNENSVRGAVIFVQAPSEFTAGGRLMQTSFGTILSSIWLDSIYSWLMIYRERQ